MDHGLQSTFGSPWSYRITCTCSIRKRAAHLITDQSDKTVGKQPRKCARRQAPAADRGPSSSALAVKAAIESRDAFAVDVQLPSGVRSRQIFDEHVRVCYSPLAGIEKRKIDFESVLYNR